MLALRGAVAFLSSSAAVFGLVFAAFCVALSTGHGTPATGLKGQKLIVLLVDGVRSDYVQRDPELTGFRRIADNGVRAEYVTPIFPSNSYPNWYTIVTGLYAESHGMIQNYMYDVEREDFFEMSPHQNASHEHWWNKSEPIWVTAEKRGIRTAMHWWDGCQVKIRGVEPSVCEHYESYWVWGTVKEDTQQRLVSVLKWFQESPDNRLALVYYEGVDATGHFRGPDAEETIQAMKDIDSILDDFQNHLDKSSLRNQVNLVVVSDHGMATSDKKDVEIIHLDRHPKVIEDIQWMLDRGSVAMVLPVPGREEKLYKQLKTLNIKGLRVYKKNEIPDKYHFKEGELVLPILLVADEGFFIQKIQNVTQMKPHYSRIFKGFHGYDPYKNTTKMRTILYARGPAFRKGAVSPPLDMTDHYNVLCYILGLEPLPNNGSWHRALPLLADNASPATIPPITLLSFCLLFLLLQLF